MIVADTGAIVALLDSSDRHHAAVVAYFDATGADWLLPWAILPEVDYLASKYCGSRTALAFAADVRDGHFRVDFAADKDLPRAVRLMEQYADLGLGLVDAVVLAQAERHKAAVVVTLDRRHFSAVRLARPLRLMPEPPP